jgi:hypothetical protein
MMATPGALRPILRCLAFSETPKRYDGHGLPVRWAYAASWSLMAEAKFAFEPNYA